MIENEREMQITLSVIRAFELRLALKEQPQPDVHERLVRAQREAIESELEVLRAQVADWEKRQGK